MAKSMKEEKEENRIVAKPKPTMNLVLLAATSSSTAQSPIASKSPSILRAPCHPDWKRAGRPAARDRNHDAPSSSQGWQIDTFLDASTGKTVATEEDQEHLNFPEDSVSVGKLVAPGYPGCSGNLWTEGNDEDWPHNLRISTNYVLHTEKVFSIVRPRYGRSPTDDLKDLDVNTATWEHSCLAHFKLQFILDKIFHKTYNLSRINLRSLWGNHFGQLRSWSKSTRRSQVCPRLIGTSLCRKDRLSCVIELFELWNPKPT